MDRSAQSPSVLETMYCAGRNSMEKVWGRSEVIIWLEDGHFDCEELGRS
jgi:hypothetical protein